ncbi:DMT family transporter [Alphaproteobacteria bacterium]|nr:DMT family transporter [Alphaproteobacteria bacterium]
MQLFVREYSRHTASMLVVVSASVWGVLWVPMRAVEAMGFPALWVQFLFMVMPALVLAIFVGRRTLAARNQWLVYAAAGFFMASAFTFYGLGLMVASVSKTTVLYYLTPVWSTILGRLFLGERAGAGRWIAIALALCGCSLVMEFNPLQASFEAVDLLGLLSGVFWGAGAVILRRYPDADFKNITFVQYVIGSILAAMAAVFLNLSFPSFDALIQAIPITFLFSAVLFLPSVLLIFRVSQYLSPGLVGILMLSEALIAVITSMLFIGEVLNFAQWAGVIIILAAGITVGLAKPSTS